MNFYTFKIPDKKNGYHYYVVGHINDVDLNLDIAVTHQHLVKNQSIIILIF